MLIATKKQSSLSANHSTDAAVAIRRWRCIAAGAWALFANQPFRLRRKRSSGLLGYCLASFLPLIYPRGLMNSPDSRLGRLLLLGENYGTYSAISSTAVGSEAAAGISVGADPDSPSHQYKDDETVDNEDALCIIAAPDWIGMAVADAHYGPESSHMLMARLHDIWAKVRPRNVDHMQEMVEFLRQGDPAQTESETTMLLTVYDRESREGFGLSFGDSTFAVLGADKLPRRQNPQDNRFVATNRRGTLRNGGQFRYAADPGDLLLIFTDGVNECHYRNPETSVQDEHIHAAARAANFEPLDVVNRVISLALGGVDGYPGGQDNIAMAAARA